MCVRGQRKGARCKMNFCNVPLIQAMSWTVRYRSGPVPPNPQDQLCDLGKATQNCKKLRFVQPIRQHDIMDPI
jgi:hypothetical protein